MTRGNEIVIQERRASYADGFSEGFSKADGLLRQVREWGNDEGYGQGYAAGRSERDEEYLLQDIIKEAFACTRGAREA